MITIKAIVQHLEQVAPPQYQESYDNAGLLVGDASKECTGVLTCLDSTEAVIEEAIKTNCNLVVAHHPIVFKGLKRFTGRTYVERVIMMAIRHDIAIYAIHTNLDNVYAQGVNAKIAERLGLINTRILAPKATLRQATVITPTHIVQELKAKLEDAIACAQMPGTSIQQSSLGVRKDGEATIRLELVYPQAQAGALQRVMAHYPEAGVLYSQIDNTNHLTGSGMVGDLPTPLSEKEFLVQLKERMGVSCIKHTGLQKKKVKTVALCGGAGGFLLSKAIAAGAQFFVTADYKYHEFFDADNRIVIADIGHYESEQFTIELLAEIIREKFGNFAVRLTKVNTNPVNYW